MRYWPMTLPSVEKRRTPTKSSGTARWAQDLIEYALIAAMFVLVCSVALTPVTQAVNNGISSVGKKFKEHVDQGLHKGWYK